MTSRCDGVYRSVPEHAGGTSPHGKTYGFKYSLEQQVVFEAVPAPALEQHFVGERRRIQGNRKAKQRIQVLKRYVLRVQAVNVLQRSQIWCPVAGIVYARKISFPVNTIPIRNMLCCCCGHVNVTLIIASN